MPTLSEKFRKIPFKHLFFMTLFVALLMSPSFNQFLVDDYRVVFKLMLFAIAYIIIYFIAELRII